MKKIFNTIAALILIFTMFMTNIPFGLLQLAYNALESRNVVDVMWHAQISRSVVDSFGPRVAYAAATPAAYQGVFSAQTSLGTQTISGVGFTPAAVIFYWTLQTAVGTLATQDVGSIGMGFTSGTANERAASMWTESAGTSDTGRISSTTSMIVVQNGLNGTLVQAANLDSFNSDGFVVNWTTASTSATIIRYLALNSAVVTNAIAETFSLTTGTGNLSISNAGFQPEFVMFLSALTSTHGSNTAEAAMMVGAATTSSAEWVTSFRSEDAQGTSDTCQAHRTDASIFFIEHDGQATNGEDCGSATPGQVDAIADFTQFTSNGFDINKSVGPAVARDVFYLALSGPSFAVGSLTSPTTQGFQSVSTLGFQPDALFFAGIGTSTTQAIEVGMNPSFGSVASTSVATAQGAVALADTDADGTADPDIRSVATSTYSEIETATPNLEAEANLVSMDSSGFTLKWANVDELQNQIMYWAIEQGPEPAGSAPTVTTNFASNVGSASATLHGSVASTGGDDADQHGFAISTDSGLATGVSTTTLGALTGVSNFSEATTTLSSNQTYYFRAYATNGTGTGLGSIKSFTTGNTTPTRSVRLFEGTSVVFYTGRIKLFQQ